jgi:hypothetical protein
LKGELKWLNKYLSQARDLDVALKRLSQLMTRVCNNRSVAFGGKHGASAIEN